MTLEEQMAIELLAYYKASSFLLWEDHSMALIDEIARQQARFAVHFAMDRVLEQCEDLAEEQNIPLRDILHKHAGWTYYSKIEEAINTIPMDDYDERG